MLLNNPGENSVCTSASHQDELTFREASVSFLFWRVHLRVRIAAMSRAHNSAKNPDTDAIITIKFDDTEDGSVTGTAYGPV